MPTDPEKSPTLRTLAPQYEETLHGVYVQALRTAIEDSTMKNIALTGAYGTGKSSVLSQLSVLYPDRVLELALSSVGIVDESDSSAKTDQSMTTSNRIQKEIVKQILYRDEPSQTQGSRFRRISRFKPAREAAIAAVTASFFTAVLLVTGHVGSITAIATAHPKWSTPIYAGSFALLVAIVYFVRWFAHNRIFIEKLSAGPATVSLSTQTSSYFDQYMDEIVYYFEQSGRDIVVFEDIDRFEDVQIFETLRALNTLLNGAQQIREAQNAPNVQAKTRGEDNPPITFIYALRDSVFERIGSAEDLKKADAAYEEVRRSNRTKFFDLVVPIVPFITHRNARDLMTAEMEGTEVSQSVIDIAARFVADKRLIINMRNEYDIFASKLLGTSSQIPSLNADRLFAMILYKSVHMSDFEAIRLGESNLDKLHDCWRRLVEANLDIALAHQNSAIERLSSPESIESRAEELGDRLIKVGTPLARHPSYQDQLRVDLGPETVTTAQVRSADFWRQVTAGERTVSIGNPHISMSRYSRSELSDLLSVRLDHIAWEKTDRSEAISDRSRAREQIEFLRHHSWEEIYARPEFVFSDPADDAYSQEGSFSQLTLRLLDSQLAQSLVAKGYINDYFALYISIYYGKHLRRDALNFVVHALERGQPDMLYPLDEADVAAILNDKGEGVLSDRSAYNVSVLDYLLASEDRYDFAITVIKNVASWDRDDRTFADRYLTYGTNIDKFVRYLTRHLPQVMCYIAEEAPVSPEHRVRLLDIAMNYQIRSIDYVTSEDVSDLIIESYTQFPSLTSREITLHKSTTMSAIASMAIQLPSMAQLNDAARDAAISLETYEINEANLRELTGQDLIALDVLHDCNARIYQTVLNNLGDYLESVRTAAHPGQYSVLQHAAFSRTLTDVLDAIADEDRGVVNQVIQLAHPQCFIDHLDSVPEATWPGLAMHGRFTASASNLVTYLDQFGAIDEPAAQLLARSTAVVPGEEVSDADLARLGAAIICADREILSAASRVQLAASLELTAPLDVSSLIPESGELVGLLIEADLIQDSADSIAKLVSDWPSREFAIVKSSNFSAFLSPEVVPSVDLKAFFESNSVPTALKSSVLADLGQYATGSDAATFMAAAQFAKSQRASLTFVEVDLLRVGGATTASLLELASISTALDDDELRTLLRSVGDPYAAIADPGTSRPLVPDTTATRSILTRMENARVVSSFRPEKRQLRVSLHQS